MGLVPAPATAQWDALFTVERINLQENTAKASRRKCEFDQMREVPFVRKANDLALATSHLPQSSSASRVTAAQSGFFILSQSGSDRSGSRSPYASIPMPAEREDSFAPLRRPRSGERAAHLTPSSKAEVIGLPERANPDAA